MTDKKKILVFLGTLTNYGGGYQYILSILNAINKKLNDRYIVNYYILNKNWCGIAPKPSGAIYFAKEKLFYKYFRKLFYLSNTSISWWRNIANKIHPFYKEFEEISPDLIIFPSEIHFALGTKISILAPIHDLMHRYEKKFPEVGNKMESYKRDLIYRNICCFSSGILVDSELGKKHLVESYKVKESKVFVLPYTIPPYILSVNNFMSDSLLRIKYKLPNKYILYPAQLWFHKNHVNLLNALINLKQKGIVVNLVLCGGRRNAAKKIFKLIEQNSLHKQVKYIEYIPKDEIALLYKNAVALVMPTFFGPTNIPPLEAIAVGCPVAISRIYAMPEQLGNAAIYFNPNDSNEIADAIFKLWTDQELRNKLICEGKRQAKGWNIDSFNNRFAQIIDQVLTQN